jgi:hypothetical protein
MTSLICAVARPRRRWLLSGLIVIAGLAPQWAAAVVFQAGDLYYASNSSPGAIYNISGGGNFSGATAFSTGMGSNLGQLAWSQDRTTMYSTQWSSGPVHQISATGVRTTYSIVTSVLGLSVINTGQVLVAQRSSPSRVFDITNPGTPVLYATINDATRNMTQLPTGEILVMGEQGRIWNVAGGTTTLWADVTAANLGGDIDFTSDGRVFASFWDSASQGGGVYEVTGGGTITSPRFATPTSSSPTFALAIDRRTNKILAAGIGATFVLDITAGGTYDFTNVLNNNVAVRFATNIPATNDMAMDFVPFIVPEASSVAFVGLSGVACWAGALVRRRMRAPE